ncbi:MAG: ATP-binding protein [Desulfuromusa sp.]|nr:ATP-binding protein [Desulfuromusa sp.]
MEKVIRQTRDSFPVLLLTGARQVGKTTLLEMCSDNHMNYVTLDDLDIRGLAQNDPGLFMQTYKTPLIIDEVQYAPQLFSYIKMVVDKEKKNGLFWLTGSQKFHLMRGVSESLAGRVAILDLLGLSQCELDNKGEEAQPFLPTEKWIKSVTEKQVKPLMDVYEQIWLGAFPRVNENKKSRDLFYRSYIQTYIQRDVKDILNITNEIAFHKFIGAVAARTGQLLNHANLARDVDIGNKTVKAWLSVLEASGLIYLLYPYHSNVTKRMVKTPKLYFLDTGLCAYLTKWIDKNSLEAGAMSGAILETYLFTEILKGYWHNGKEANFYFYRDLDQKEVDLLIESDGVLYPIEFKKTGTPSKTATKHFKVLKKLKKNIGQGAVICFIEKHIPLSTEVTAIPVAYL